MMRPTLYARLDEPLSDQGLDQVKGLFNLVIMPQVDYPPIY